jgi:mycothiol synthase
MTDRGAGGGAADRYGSRGWQTPTDSRRMQALIARCWRADWPDVHLHAGDVDWWTVQALGTQPGLEERIRLWFDGEPDATELIGFAWYGLLGGADLVVSPDDRTASLIGPMTGWIEGRAARIEPNRGDPVAALRIWTVETHEGSMKALARLGYGRADVPSFHHFVGRTDQLDLAEPTLPEGYRIGTIATDADVAARVVVGHAAFTRSTLTEDAYRFCRTTPLYRPALDTVIVAPDGAFAAFALAWLDPLSLGVELEPVGVHPDHQRRGLGRAVCRAALRAAGAMGGRQVVIAAESGNPAANGLYASLGLGLSARVVALSRAATSA